MEFTNCIKNIKMIQETKTQDLKRKTIRIPQRVVDPSASICLLMKRQAQLSQTNRSVERPLEPKPLRLREVARKVKNLSRKRAVGRRLKEFLVLARRNEKINCFSMQQFYKNINFSIILSLKI